MAPERRAAEAPGWLSRSAAVSWRLLVVAAAIGVVGFLLVYLRLVVLPVIVALFLSTLLAPPAGWLRARGWPPLAATWAVMGGAVLVIAGASAALARGLLSGATLAVEVVTGALLSLVLTFFFIKDGDRMGNWFANHAGARADDVRAAGRRAFETLGAYLRGQATVGLIDGVFIGIGLAVVGVPLAVPLAFLVFLGAFLPIVGAFLSGLIAALVALVSKGLVAALIIVGITILVQQLEGHVLAPLVLGRAVKLHPAVILLALTGGGVVGGIIGAALAVPSVAVVTSVATYLRNRPPDPLPLGADGRAGVPQGQHDDRGGHRQGG